MELIERIKKLYNLKLYYVWVYPLDEGTDNELILDPCCIYFEFENHEYLKVIAIPGEGKIAVSIEEKIEYPSDIEFIFKIDLRSYILKYPETNYYLEKVGGVNTEIDGNRLICEAIELSLYAEAYDKMKQNIFIYTNLYGLSIGGLDKKIYWIEGFYIPLYGDKVDERWF